MNITKALAGGWVYDGRAVGKMIQAVRRGDLTAAAEAADEAERIRDQAAQRVAEAQTRWRREMAS